MLMPWRRKPEPPRTPPLKRAPSPLAPLPSAPREAVLLRPPGALREDRFLETCERCGKCAAACPVGAIAKADDGTPLIDPSQTACVLCDGLACTHACPSGALLPLAAKADVRIGTALIDRDRCTAYRGLPCRICVELCPVPQVLKLVKGARAYVPVAGAQACTGCGVCEEHCPAEGAIRVVALRPGHDGRVLLSADAAQRMQEL